MNAFCSLKMTWPKTIAPLFFSFFSCVLTLSVMKWRWCFWELFREKLRRSNNKLGGGCNYRIFMINPTPGEMIQFDEHIFQVGWFNHQLANFFWDEAQRTHPSSQDTASPLMLGPHGEMMKWLGVWFWEPKKPPYKQFKLDGTGETTISQIKIWSIIQLKQPNWSNQIEAAKLKQHETTIYKRLFGVPGSFAKHGGFHQSFRWNWKVKKLPVVSLAAGALSIAATIEVPFLNYRVVKGGGSKGRGFPNLP